MVSLIWLILGLVGLWIGTELAVRSALSVADRYQLSHVFVGLTILAVGTDLPELVVAVSASVERLGGVETSSIVVGNAIGSAVAQITLVLGIAGLASYLTLSRKNVVADGFSMLGAIILLGLLGADGNLSRLDGAVLLVGFGAYWVALFSREDVATKVRRHTSGVPWSQVLALVGGIIVLVLSSEAVVDHAVRLAEILGVRQSLVAILIIGFGTSLPELAISVKAVQAQGTGLSVGNLIGSNIFDILVPVGLGSSISELRMEPNLTLFDLPFLFVVSSMALVFLVRKRRLQGREALVLLGAYVLYAMLKTSGEFVPGLGI